MFYLHDISLLEMEGKEASPRVTDNVPNFEYNLHEVVAAILCHSIHGARHFGVYFRFSLRKFVKYIDILIYFDGNLKNDVTITC